ncbi:hypothetical protein EG68_04091 [Paragonimus skrjabini miyazakii]|uniref:Uncharacterized protein n=1 Tax=Paragonimus skrjabini miyazakii TaxID=59628 RepID=A0A8S9Z6G8_9TREM|nr:hypothetical protein EG68_04091 [Paragonimus skrjabini miyazakii]
MLVYDITNRKSFTHIENWLANLKQILGVQNSEPHFALIGNKIDLRCSTCCVTSKEHESFASDNLLGSYLVSAKTGEALDQMFVRILTSVLGLQMTYEDWMKTQPVIAANVRQNINCTTNEPMEPSQTCVLL